mgnify:FL=1
MNELPALGYQLFISEYIHGQLFVRLYYGLPSLIGNIFLWFTGVGGLISLLSGSSFSKDGNGNQ